MKSITSTNTLKGSAAKLFVFALLIAVLITAFMPITNSVVYGEETTGGAVTPPVAKVWKVTFIDIDGSVLKVQDVEDGKDATPPTIKAKKGYKFLGWNAYYTNVKKNITVSAVYELVMTTDKEEKGKLADPDTAKPPKEEVATQPEKIAVATEGGLEVIDTTEAGVTTPEIIKNNPTPTTVIEEDATGISPITIVLIALIAALVIAAIIFIIVRKRRKDKAAA